MSLSVGMSVLSAWEWVVALSVGMGGCSQCENGWVLSVWEWVGALSVGMGVLSVWEWVCSQCGNECALSVGMGVLSV